MGRVLLQEVAGPAPVFPRADPAAAASDADDVQAEEQILPEVPGGNRIFEVSIGRGDDAHVDLNVSLAAEPGELAVLQDVEQLGLQRRRHLADLVEEDRAVVRELELARLGLQRAAERAALEPEHLRLEQVTRQRGAVDLHKGPVAPG